MRQRNKKRKDLIGYSLIGAFVIVIVSIAIFMITKETIEIDKETMCRADGKYNVNVLVIDVSENYNNVQVAQITNIFDDTLSKLNVGEQIQVFFLDGEISTKEKPVISLCKPADGEGENIFISNPELMKKRWEKKFHEPLMKIIGSVAKNNIAASSPIMETLQIINNIALPYSKNPQFKYKLIIVSDMIQNSPLLSFYKESKENVKNFNNTKNFYKIKTDLTHVLIDLYITRRDGNEALQTTDYMNFWADFFQRMNAHVNKIKMIDG